MDPYEADLEKIPASDPFKNDNGFGRYKPRPDDFKPDPHHINSATPESLAYWASVLKRCTADERIYPNEFGGRDVFALGGVIVKSAHLNGNEGRDYGFPDANEVAAIALAKPVLEQMQIRVPEIYFSGKIDGYSVLVQERITGVGLNVAFRYLSPAQKASFKDQARAVLRKLHAVQPKPESPSGCTRSYVVPDPDPITHRGVQEREYEIIFSDHADDPDLGFVHNDLSESNMIVSNDRIVGVIDWEMAGFFGWKTAADVHAQIRGPKPENYVSLNLPEAVLNDFMYWEDLYDRAAL